MPLDPQVASYLQARAGRGLPPTHTQTPEQHRGFLDPGPFPAGPAGLHSVANLAFEASGGRIELRHYRPVDAAGPQPALLFMHGGGWVCGTLDSIDGTMRHLALLSGVDIFSVRYRRSPEHRFPAALDDVDAAVDWVFANAVQLGLDPMRIAIGGASAGGNLAAAIALRDRDRGRARLAYQLLVYPVVSARCDTPSFRENATGYVLTADGMRWYWNHYLGPDADAASPYVSPLDADDLSGLPPAHILTAEFDPLRDEGRLFAERLRADGVEAVYSEYPGMVHGFFNQWHLIDVGLTSIADAATRLSAHLSPPR